MEDNESLSIDDISSVVQRQYFPDLPFGQTQQTLNLLMRKTQDYLRSNVFDGDELDEFSSDEVERYFVQTCEFVDDLRTALNPLGRGERFPKNPTLIFSDLQLESKFLLEKPDKESVRNREDYDFERRKKYSAWISHLDGVNISSADLINILMDGAESRYFWPIGDLSSIVDVYVRCPWLQCYFIDRIFIRSIIYQIICEYSRDVSYLIYPPPKNIFAFSAKNKTYKEKLEKHENWQLFKSAGYMIFSIVMGIAAADATKWWIGVIVWLGMDWLFSITEYFSENSRQKDSKRLLANLDKIYAVLMSTKQSGLTPAYVRRRLHDVEDFGLRFPANLYLILDLAEQRSGIYWSLND